MMRLPVVFVAAVLLPATLAAQSATELAETAANPIADLISVPLQLNNDFGLGEFDRTRNVLNIQPVVPLMGGRLITRTIIPFVWLPDITSESGTFSSGLADMQLTAYWVPESEGLMWGVGPILEFPTGGSERGSEKWNAGPSIVVLAQPAPWTLGLLANNVWSFAGDDERPDVNRGLAQYFIVRQLGNGWYVNSAPIIGAGSVGNSAPLVGAAWAVQEPAPNRYTMSSVDNTTTSPSAGVLPNRSPSAGVAGNSAPVAGAAWASHMVVPSFHL